MPLPACAAATMPTPQSSPVGVGPEAVERRRRKHHDFLPVSHARPLAARRYFWKRLFGLSGTVISINPASRAGTRVRLAEVFIVPEA